MRIWFVLILSVQSEMFHGLFYGSRCCFVRSFICLIICRTRKISNAAFISLSFDLKWTISHFILFAIFCLLSSCRSLSHSVPRAPPFSSSNSVKHHATRINQLNTKLIETVVCACVFCISLLKCEIKWNKANKQMNGKLK